MYAAGEYDLAGFTVGVVERSEIVTGQTIEAGDIVLGLESNGLHSNGYSLARKVLLEHAKLPLADRVESLGEPLVDALLRPTPIYARAAVAALSVKGVRGFSHITGGGLPGNVPRVLPLGKRVFLKRGSWPIPPVFTWLQRLGDVEQPEMDKVFNNGIGFVMIVSPYFADSIQRRLNDEESVQTFVIGEVRDGEADVEWN